MFSPPTTSAPLAALSPALRERLRRVKLLAVDVDGTLTDAGIYLGENGEVVKRWNSRDGYGIHLAVTHGLRVAFVTGRQSPLVTARAAELHVDEVYLGCEDKPAAVRELAEKHGVCCCIHSHSGPNLSADATLVWLLLKDRNPKYVGAYVDPGHMIVEGGKSGWMMGIDLLRTYTQMVAVKDFGWSQTEPGTKNWVARLVPLAEGMVPWPDVFSKLADAGFDGAYLDIIDAYEYYADRGRATAAQEMAEFVAAIEVVVAAGADPLADVCELAVLGEQVGLAIALGEGPAADAYRAIVDLLVTEATPSIEMAGCSARLLAAAVEALDAADA